MDNKDIEGLNKLATDLIIEARTMAIGDIEGLIKGKAETPDGHGPDPDNTLQPFDPAKANFDKLIDELDAKHDEATRALNIIGEWIERVWASRIDNEDDTKKLEQYKNVLDYILANVDTKEPGYSTTGPYVK